MSKSMVHLTPPLEEIWQFQPTSGIVTWIPPVVANKTVFLRSKDNCIYALDVDSGQEKWSLKMDKKIGTMKIESGKFFVYSCLEKKGFLTPTAYDRTLQAIDAVTGETQWMVGEERGYVLSPVYAASNGIVYVKGLDKSLCALDINNGRELWRFSTGNDIQDITVSRGAVFFGCRDKHVYALEAESGRKLWEFKNGEKEHFRPIVADDKVLVGKKDLYALDVESGSLIWKKKKAGGSPVIVGKTVICPWELTFIGLENGAEVGIKLSPKSQVPLDDSLVKKGILYTLMHERTGFLKGNTYLLAYSLEMPVGLMWYLVTTSDEQPGVFKLFVGEDYVYTTGLYGINKSRFTKRWEFPGFVPIGIVDGKLICTSDEKIVALSGSPDSSAISILEPGNEVAPLPKFVAMMVLPKEGKIAWPQCCCLCCGPVEKHVNQSKEINKISLSAVGIPYCKRCHKKTQGIFRKEKAGVEITRTSPPTFTFRNEKYWAMFMEANRAR